VRRDARHRADALPFETIDQKAATGSWHWFFLIQGRGMPEHLIGCDPEFFVRRMFGTLLHDVDAIELAAWTEYLRCFRNPETIRATCDEYRAGASIQHSQRFLHELEDCAAHAGTAV
jgi:haloacetate dehalogenase